MRGRGAIEQARAVRGIGAAAALFALCAATATASAPTTASNKRLAERDGPKLLTLVNVPPNASSQSSEPAHDDGWLAGPGGFGLDWRNLLDVHEFWHAPDTFQSTLAYIKAHPPGGSRLTDWGAITGPGVPLNHSLAYYFKDIKGRISPRLLDITLVRLNDGSTGVRADAEDVWIVTRPRSERVPRGVREIDIRTRLGDQRRPTFSLKLTNRAKIRKIVRLVDALPLDQPFKYPCMGGPRGPFLTTTVSFRGGHGALLARAISDWYGRSSDAPCLRIDFSIHGRRQPSLVGNFLYRLHRLLGVHLEGNSRRQ